MSHNPDLPDQNPNSTQPPSEERLLNPSDDAFVIANGLAELGEKLNDGLHAFAKAMTIVGEGLNRIADGMNPPDMEPAPPNTYMDGKPIGGK